ncbi:MAG: hypothetical protein HXX10_17045 [Rhodoplanes sp.]|uniref:hypothetical protein n=1 Tax=Rhodoplanes sp. TaxID=1968906 RepID=UPI0017DA127B|nr:hypothetical protein [Rhodoplanes sp.]NVO15742.1 hypothetical protein [Rhodoplanes sp.]
MTPDLAAAIAGAYRVFGRYRMSGAVTVCRCNVCVGPDDARALSILPLTSISSSLLAQYTHSAHEWDDDVAYEFRYFLPRYLDLIAAGDAPSTTGAEICLERLHRADYRNAWPAAERDAIDAFFLAQLRADLLTPPLLDATGLPAWHSDPAEDTLCMAAHAGGDVAPLLAAWDAERGRLPVLHIAVMVATADWIGNRLANRGWVGLPRPHVEAAHDAVMRWLLRPATRDRLEAACLDEQDDGAAALLSLAETIVAGRLPPA